MQNDVSVAHCECDSSGGTQRRTRGRREHAGGWRGLDGRWVEMGEGVAVGGGNDKRNEETEADGRPRFFWGYLMSWWISD